MYLNSILRLKGDFLKIVTICSYFYTQTDILFMFTE